MSKIFDTHVHYNLTPLSNHAEQYRQAAIAKGVARACVVGTDLDYSRAALQLRSLYPDYFSASIGLHPDVATDLCTAANYDCERIATQLTTKMTTFADLVGQSPDAWGEIGLDFFHLDRTSPHYEIIKATQEDLFVRQLRMVATSKKPIILHLRDLPKFYDDPASAYQTALRLLCDYVPEYTLIFHCFSGSADYLDQVLSFSHSYVSFAGNLTFKSATALRDLAARVPRTRLLLETDAPFLSPEPVRGRICEPEFIAHTATFASTRLGVDLDQVYQNSLAIFRPNEV